jgi:hypothetical protein
MKIEFIVYAIWGLAALGVANLLVRAVRNRGFKAAMFGAPIKRTVGEIDLGKHGMMRTRLRLHSLEAREAGVRTIGIEVITTSRLSYHMFPIRMTPEEAALFRDLLSRAAAGE